MSDNTTPGTITSRASWWQRLTRRPSRTRVTLLEDISADLLAIRAAADSRDGVVSDLLSVMEDIRDDIRAIRNTIETREN